MTKLEIQPLDTQSPKIADDSVAVMVTSQIVYDAISALFDGPVTTLDKQITHGMIGRQAFLLCGFIFPKQSDRLQAVNEFLIHHSRIRVVALLPIGFAVN